MFDEGAKIAIHSNEYGGSDWLTLREKGTNSTINTKCTSSLGIISENVEIIL